MKRVRFFLMSLCWLAGALPAAGQSDFVSLSEAEGLSQSVVTCLFQDSGGWMWAGTQRGLNRFDGYEFTVFLRDAEDPHSLPDPYLRQLSEDQADRLWVGTQSGLAYFDQRTLQFFPVPLPDSPAQVQALLNDDRGHLWVGTPAGLYHTKAPGQQASFQHFSLGGDTLRQVRELYQDREARIWVGTENGLWQIDAQRQRLRHYLAGENPFARNTVQHLLQDREGHLYAGTTAGLYRWQPTQDRFEPVQLPADSTGLLGRVEVSALAEDRTGQLWIGTFGAGLWRYNPKTGRLASFRHEASRAGSLGNDFISSLFVDPSGLLWIGTYGDGINQYDLTRIRFGQLPEEGGKQDLLPGPDVYAVWEDEKGYLWTGTDEGLARIEPERKKSERVGVGGPAPLDDQLINVIKQDRRGNLWVGTGRGLNGLLRADLQAKNYRFFSPGTDSLLKGRGVLSLLPGKAPGPLLWIGTSEGLYPLNDKLEVQPALRLGEGNPPVVQTLLQDQQGTLWVGTADGLLQTDARQRYLLPVKSQAEMLVSASILSLHQDREGYLWLGTEGEGLLRFNPATGELKTYTIEDGLPENFVYAIAEDEQGYLWLSTQNGLCKLRRNRLAGTVSFVTYRGRDLLSSDVFNIGAFCRGQDGTFYFGSTQGLTFFQPDEIRENDYVPPVVLTELQLTWDSVGISPEGVLQAHISETRRLNLNHRQNVLYFEFAALSFVQNQHNQYAYKMEPFDQDWIYSKGKRSATYTNLDPGTYTFRVKAANNEGYWNQEGAELQIVITPPFYRTAWFYLLCGLAVVLGVLAYIRLRTRQLEMNRKLLQQKVEERTREVLEQKEKLEATLHDLKAAQTQLIDAEKMASLGQLTAGVAHEINNPITFVSGNVNPLKRDIEEVLEVLAKYDELVEKQGLDQAFAEVRQLKQDLDYEFLLDEINSLLLGIREGAERTAKIVKGLRNFSRMDEDELKPCDINQGLDSTLLILRNSFKSRIEVRKAYGELPEVMGYPGKLNQVFMNILNNAIQAIAGEGTIFLHTEAVGQEVRISIRDTGAGMSEAVRKRIFEPFYTTKEVGVGTGLGLAISFGIIQDHQGSIEVESEPGQGTTFLIRLPLRPPQP
jgi:ligand-binding sensor domain-containing protein/signal transduction histidine kinase